MGHDLGPSNIGTPGTLGPCPSLCTLTHTPVHVLPCMCVLACVFACVHVRVRACACTYARTRARTRMCVRTSRARTRTRTRTLTRVPRVSVHVLKRSQSNARALLIGQCECDVDARDLMTSITET